MHATTLQSSFSLTAPLATVAELVPELTAGLGLGTVVVVGGTVVVVGVGRQPGHVPCRVSE